MKKTISFLLVLVFVFLLSSCGQKESTIPELRDDSAVRVGMSETETFEESTTEQTTFEESTTEQTTSIEWTEFSYDTKDTDGYTYKITVKLSPWILYSETDIINEAWSVVGKDHSLPTFDSWGFKKYENQYWKPYSSGTPMFNAGSWAYAMSDMYYCVGNVSIKNTTEGWDISSSSTRTGKAQMVFQPYGYRSDAAKTIAKVFYKSSTESWWNGIDVSAKMTSNNWGPVPFVFIAPENFSPNFPNGEYLENLQTGYFEPFGITDPEPVYVDIIGKNGEKFSPIKEKE